MTTEARTARAAPNPDSAPDSDLEFRYASHGGVTLRYAPSVDALTIRYAEGRVLHTAEIGVEQYMDYSDDGLILSVEVLDASRGVDLEGIPRAADVAAALAELGIPAETE